MTGMLASVNSLEEAQLVLAEQVDIIDLKEPALGALGALEHTKVKAIVDTLNHHCLISATIGDLPMQPSVIIDAVKLMGQTGVNFIKIGFFPDGDAVEVIKKLSQLSAQHQMIAVLFADTITDFTLVEIIAESGFHGIMLDTMDKAKGSLLNNMSYSDVIQFVNTVKSKNLLCGLAGSLTLLDIPVLLKTSAHYLGFRSALCDHHIRTSQLCVLAVREVKQAICKPT